MKSIEYSFFLRVPDKALLDDDLQIFVWTKSEFLFTDIEYYLSFKYYTSEFVIHIWLSAIAVMVKYTTIFAQFWIVLLVPNRSWKICENISDNLGPNITRTCP